MTINLTNVTDAMNLYEVQIAINQLTGGLYAALWLFAFFLVMLISLKAYDTPASLLVSSFVTMIVGGLFVFLQLIGWEIFSVVMVLLIGAIIMNVWKSD